MKIRRHQPDTFDKILDDLSESSYTEDEQQGPVDVKARAKVVVMFVNEDNCRKLINATIAKQMTELFYFLASDSWGAKRVPVDKQEWAAEGTVTILPQRQVVHGLSVHITVSHLTCISVDLYGD